MIEYNFHIKNEWGKYLNLIFEDIDDVNYKWQILDDEILTTDDYLFDSKIDVFSNYDFWNILSIDRYYIIFATIKLYESENDLKNDNWAIFLEIVDSYIVNIKLKNANFTKRISKNIESIIDFD